MRHIRTFAVRLCASVLFVGLLWSQAQPKPTPAPSPTPQTTAPVTSSGSCLADYRNLSGVVHCSVKTNYSAAPNSAQCRDGSYSFSQPRCGTCSHRGGVAK